MYNAKLHNEQLQVIGELKEHFPVWRQAQSKAHLIMWPFCTGSQSESSTSFLAPWALAAVPPTLWLCDASKQWELTDRIMSWMLFAVVYLFIDRSQDNVTWTFCKVKNANSGVTTTWTLILPAFPLIVLWLRASDLTFWSRFFSPL
jgi:hypothetical protein